MRSNRSHAHDAANTGSRQEQSVSIPSNSAGAHLSLVAGDGSRLDAASSGGLFSAVALWLTGNPSSWSSSPLLGSTGMWH